MTTNIKTDIINLTNDTVSPEGFQIQSIVGMKKDAAIKLLEENKREWRIIQEDGDAKMNIDNFKTGRVNLVIDKGFVSSYRLG